MSAGKNRVRLALEPLEDRWTPSAPGGDLVGPFPAPPVGPHAAVSPVEATREHGVPIRTTFRCSVDISTGTVSSTGFATGGLGHFTSLGHMDSLVIDTDADQGVYSGTGTLVTAHGDQLFFTFTTSWQLSTGQGTHFITVTGGTGRYAGASGSGYSDCTITPGPTPETYLCYTEGSGILILPNGHA